MSIKKLLVLTLTLICILGLSIEQIKMQQKSCINQEVRTAEYNKESLKEESLFVTLDEHSLVENERGFEAIGIKKYDGSMFEDVDYCGLDSSDEVSIRYNVIYLENENTILLSITIEGNEDVPIISSIPGLISLNDAGEEDVMFAYEGEYLWLSDIIDEGLIDENGLFRWLVSKIAEAIVTQIEGRVLFFINGFKFVKDIITLQFDKALADFGAMYLNMYEGIDSNGKLNGVYHANFDCWQQYFGYTDFYDKVFKAFTIMDRRKFEFKVDTNNDGVKDQDYILWAWKGDYLNLGVGAELGVYKKWIFDPTFWTVDKDASMKMTLNLDIIKNNKKTNLFYWAPSDKQWWITGFNYKNHISSGEISELKATYEVNFITKNYGDTFNKNFINSFLEENDSRSWGWIQTSNPMTYRFSF